MVVNLFFQSFPTNFKIPEIKMTVTTFFLLQVFCKIYCNMYSETDSLFILSNSTLFNMQAIRSPIKKKIFEIESRAFVSFQTSFVTTVA